MGQIDHNTRASLEPPARADQAMPRPHDYDYDDEADIRAELEHIQNEAALDAELYAANFDLVLASAVAEVEA